MFRLFNLFVALVFMFVLALANDAHAFGGRVVVRGGGIGRSNVFVNAGGANVAVRGGVFGPRVFVNNGFGGGFGGSSVIVGNRGFGGFGSRGVFVNPGFVQPSVVVPGAFGVQSFNGGFNSFGVGGCGGGAVIAPSSFNSFQSFSTFGY